MPTRWRGSIDAATPETGQRNARWVAEHRPFLIALALAALVRVVVQFAFWPAMVHSDGPTYLLFLDTFEPNAERPDGYGLLVLYPLSWLTSKVLAVAVVQHVMGLVTAALVYALVYRWGAGRRLALVASVPVLFDSLQLNLEHTVLSDTLFELLVVLAVVVLGWRRRPTPGAALAAGLILGVSVTVRLVGEPLVLAGVAYCLLAGRSWLVRLAGAVALIVGFALPVGAYAAWYHHDHGVYALSQSAGKSAYMRTTTFVDCTTLSVPAYERVLCPREPLGQRYDPTYYAWHDPRTLPRLKPPPGTTPDQAMREFALAAIRQQPADYAGVVLRDFLLNFDVWRADRFEYDTAHKWRMSTYLSYKPTDWTRPAYEEHGGEQLTAREPFAIVAAVYGWVVYLPGPVLFACLVTGMLGGLGLGRARRSGLNSICLLLTVSGAGLLLVPAVTADFSWRYQLPALALLPAGAAIAFTALRGGQADVGTPATASTD